ncbi:MAG: hypothetical protein ABEK42_02690, partial [Thiohalorhabdaceae bacterium]
MPDEPRTTNTLTGGGGVDRVEDTGANDYFAGKGGSDRFDIPPYSEPDEAGDDWVRGGPGRDGASAGPGSDLVAGNKDGDLLFGGEGPDQVHGGDRTSPEEAISRGYRGKGPQDAIPSSGVYIRGGGGSDVVAGNAGDDFVTATEADDAVSGGNGSDLVATGQGRDFVRGDLEFAFAKKDWSISLNAAKVGLVDSPVFDTTNLLVFPSKSPGRDVLYTGRGADAAFGEG